MPASNQERAAGHISVFSPLTNYRWEEVLAFMSGSDLIEAFAGGHPVAGCETELATYRRLRAAAKSGRQPERRASGIDPASKVPPSQMQRIWWKWWQDSEKPECLFLKVVFQDTPSVLVSHCIECLVEKHAILTSRFTEFDDGLFFQLNDGSKFKVDNPPTFNSSEEAIQFFEDWKETPIRHDGDWLVRASVAMVQNDAIAALQLSHLICDGYSLSVLEKDLREMVEQHKAGYFDKPKRDFSFLEYAIAERRWYESDEVVELRRYWAKRVECSPPFLSPSGISIGGRTSGPRTRFQISLTPRLVQKIFAQARKMQTTPYVIFLSVYALALSDWSKCNEFYISSVYDLRSTPELLSTVGFLTCTRLTEISFKGALDVREAVNHVWLQEKFSRSIPLPPGAGDDPSIRDGVSALLNYVSDEKMSSQMSLGQSSELPCVIGEPVITPPRPAGHPVSLVLRHRPGGVVWGALDFGGNRINLSEMRSLANSLVAKLEAICLAG